MTMEAPPFEDVLPIEDGNVAMSWSFSELYILGVENSGKNLLLDLLYYLYIPTYHNQIEVD